MVFDESLEASGDYRFDWINSLTMALSEKLAFKTSLQLLFEYCTAVSEQHQAAATT